MKILFKIGKIIFKLVAILLILLALLLEHMSKISNIPNVKSRNNGDKIIKSSNMYPRFKHYGY